MHHICTTRADAAPRDWAPTARGASGRLFGRPVGRHPQVTTCRSPVVRIETWLSLLFWMSPAMPQAPFAWPATWRRRWKLRPLQRPARQRPGRPSGALAADLVVRKPMAQLCQSRRRQPARLSAGTGQRPSRRHAVRQTQRPSPPGVLVLRRRWGGVLSWVLARHQRGRKSRSSTLDLGLGDETVPRHHWRGTTAVRRTLRVCGFDRP